jgi:rhodanese-related sulfurtransferase
MPGRAIRMGYTRVHWYRGGLKAWKESGLPMN